MAGRGKPRGEVSGAKPGAGLRFLAAASLQIQQLAWRQVRGLVVTVVDFVAVRYQ